MKIYDSNIGGTQAGATQRSEETQQAERANRGRASGSGTDGDRVEFSGTLGRLSRVLSTFQNDRAGLVRTLAMQYQNGTYRADAAATSRAMIAEALGGRAETGLQ
jgi:hypothetical protein